MNSIIRCICRLLLLTLFSASYGQNPVPYSGKVSVDGVNFDGSAQFSFELIDGNFSVHWHNGVDTNETILVSVRNGRYLVLLGGQGMKPLPSRLFLDHDKLFLRVHVDLITPPHPRIGSFVYQACVLMLV